MKEILEERGEEEREREREREGESIGFLYNSPQLCKPASLGVLP